MAAQYPNNVVTKKGLNAIAESVATKQGLIFTKVLVGDGNMPSTNISDLTSIVSKKMELPITSYNNEGNGQFLVRAALSNALLDVGFFPREVALYAKVGESGEEVLYSYTNGENNVGYIPDKTTPIESEVYNIRTVIGNATNVIAKLSDDTFVTVLDLADHNNSTDSHTPLLNKWINSSFTKFKDAVLEVLDCKFKLDINGYVRLGFLGGFTIQWGTVTVTTGVADANKISEGEVVFTFPTAFTSAPWAIFTGALDTINVRLESASIFGNTPTNVRLFLHALGTQNVQLSSFVLAIGK